MIIIVLGTILVVFYFGKNKNARTINQSEIITVDELRAELGIINSYSNLYSINPEDYPMVLGSYSENGLILIKQYFCSDICPDNGGVDIVFQNIRTKEDCAKVGGRDLIDLAWGGYIGCAPIIDE